MDQSAANREAYEYWGYLFKADKTGTDKLRFLLQGLKDYINQTFEPSDQPDLLPSQVAAFYRSVHGDYDQLFLHTPPESIAFIYKSLGCLHSLQPLPGAAFSDPTIPALKTEGWIMWQTIQLLLGPEEHAGFLIEAVQSCDIRDHATGELFPKVLSRSCFPSEPDKHMVAWYEGVSERLKREAEEEAQGVHEPERDDRRRPERYQVRGEYDDDGSLTSRGPALAYFRNPLYRHVDGRPSIVRRASKTRAAVKGKEAAMAVGHVFRNIGSPHLWDGNEKDRLRRKSVPDRHHYRDDSYSRQRHLHSSDSEYDLEPLPEHRSVSNNSRPRQSHSYEAMPNRRSGEHPPQPPGRRPSPPSPTSESSDSDVRPGAGFAPSAGPLFATQVAHHPPVRRESPRRLSRSRSRSHSHSHSRHGPVERDRRDNYSTADRRDRRERHGPRRSLYSDDDDDNDPPRRPAFGRRVSRSLDGRQSYDHDDDRRRSSRPNGPERDESPRRGKSIRFAEPPSIKGVDGRRYADPSPWR